MPCVLSIGYFYYAESYVDRIVWIEEHVVCSFCFLGGHEVHETES